jgi:exo-beta-1,3-glucanase (GH17 family)
MYIILKVILLFILTIVVKLFRHYSLTSMQPLSLMSHFYHHRHHHHKTSDHVSIERLKLRGLNYTPRKGPASLNEKDECKSVDQIRSDFKILVQITDRFHLYALSECSQAELVLPIAMEMGFKVFLNLWVDGSPFDDPNGSFANELVELEHLLDKKLINSTTVMAISVGSESYHRHETTIEENIAYLNIVKAKLQNRNASDILLTITDIDKTFMKYPKLMAAVDFASINAFPFFDTAYGKKKSNGAIAYLIHYILDPLLDESKKAGKQPLFLTETGWYVRGDFRY